MLTRRGWGTGLLAGILLIAGRVFGTIEGYIAGAALAVLLVASVLWLVLTRIDVSVHRVLHPPKVHAGSSSRVDLTVSNRGRRSSPVLSVRDQVSGTRGASLLVGPLRAGAEVRAAYRFSTARRGIVTVGPLQVELTDPFGMARLRLPAAGVSELVVYPEIEPLVALPLSSGNDPLAGAEHPNSLGRNGEDFYALRAYVVGDDLRRVHWAATARHDELMVRQDELPWQGRTTVILDDRRAVHSAATFERAVSAAASIVLAGARRRDLVRLVTTSGTDSGFGAGRHHVEGLLEALACIEPSRVPGMDAPVELLGHSGVSGALILLTGDTPSAELDVFRTRVQASGLEAQLAFTPTTSAGPVVNGSVVRIGPDTPLVAGWASVVSRRTTSGAARRPR
ncbi:MAG TPA: DUF58 domain-containing protein [Acidimicrobiales bacterium]